MSQSRINARILIAMAHDLLVAAGVWIFAYLLRWNFDLTPYSQQILWETLPAVLAVQMGCFLYFGLYRGIWRFASLHDLRLIAKAVGCSALIIPILLLFWRNGLGIPRTIYVLDPLLLIVFMSGGRLVYRWWKELHGSGKQPEDQHPVLILGASKEALSLIGELENNPHWHVVGILDDNRERVGRHISGRFVLGSIADIEQIARDTNCRHAILAMRGTDHATRRRYFDVCERAHVKLLVVPGLDELMSGRVRVSQIRHVDVDDLLGRDPVQLDGSGLRFLLEGQSVLVTGAGGSIGSELCMQIARFRPERLVLYEQGEFALYGVAERLSALYPSMRVEQVLGDVKDEQRLVDTFTRHHPGVVYHAAAYKHVPLLETGNSWEGVRNNALGTRIVADVAARFGVNRFVFVSTDKAVNPTNVMGATKRMAEMILQHRHRSTGMQLASVRFGNVLGSSGSVIPKFREQIARGGPITVTHPDITRYFMSIPEAAQLVLQAGLMCRGGEVFVLDMGEPIRIVDLALTMVRLCGFADGEIPITFTGLRPGEKLYEELLADNEKTMATPHPKLRVARAIEAPGSGWDQACSAWLDSTGTWSDDEVREQLRRFVPEYQPVSVDEGGAENVPAYSLLAPEGSKSLLAPEGGKTLLAPGSDRKLLTRDDNEDGSSTGAGSPRA